MASVNNENQSRPSEDAAERKIVTKVAFMPISNPEETCALCGNSASSHFQSGPDSDPRLAAMWCPSPYGGFTSLNFRHKINSVAPSEEAPCEYCGPVCYNGAEHNARVGFGDRYVAPSEDGVKAKESKAKCGWTSGKLTCSLDDHQVGTPHWDGRFSVAENMNMSLTWFPPTTPNLVGVKAKADFETTVLRAKDPCYVFNDHGCKCGWCHDCGWLKADHIPPIPSSGGECVEDIYLHEIGWHYGYVTCSCGWAHRSYYVQPSGSNWIDTDAGTMLFVEHVRESSTTKCYEKRIAELEATFSEDDWKREAGNIIDKVHRVPEDYVNEELVELLKLKFIPKRDEGQR